VCGIRVGETILSYRTTEDTVKDKYFNETRILLNMLKKLQIYDTIRNSAKYST